MLKWHTIRVYYYINLLIYTLTMLVLTTFILLLHSNYEAEALRVIFKIPIMFPFKNRTFISDAYIVINYHADPISNTLVVVALFRDDHFRAGAFPTRHSSAPLFVQPGKLHRIRLLFIFILKYRYVRSSL